jgi:thymidylate kinase
MNYQNGQSTGAKWLFFLAMVILFGSVAFGFNLKDAKWLNREIASATANQMNVATDIDRRKAELDLQVLQTQTEIRIAEMKRQAEYEAAKQQQELNAATAAAMQWSNFQAGLYNAINIGLMVVMIAVSAMLIIAGIAVAIGLYKILNARAQAIQSTQSTVVIVRKRQPSLAAQRARQREREEREREREINARVDQLFSHSEPLWSVTGEKSENLERGNLPLAI